jgi:hypothetical protein
MCGHTKSTTCRLNVLSAHLLVKFDSTHHTFYFICGCELARLEDSSSQSGIYSRPSFLPSNHENAPLLNNLGLKLKHLLLN